MQLSGEGNGAATTRRPVGFLDLPGETHLAIFLSYTEIRDPASQTALDYQRDRCAFCVICKTTFPAARSALYYRIALEDCRHHMLKRSLSADPHLYTQVRHLFFYNLRHNAPTTSSTPLDFLDHLNLNSLRIESELSLDEMLPAIIRATRRQNSQLRSFKIETAISVATEGSSCASTCIALRDLSMGSLERLVFYINYLRDNPDPQAIDMGINDQTRHYYDTPAFSNIAYFALNDIFYEEDSMSPSALLATLASIPSSVIGLSLTLRCRHSISATFWHRVPLLKHLAFANNVGMRLTNFPWVKYCRNRRWADRSCPRADLHSNLCGAKRSRIISMAICQNQPKLCAFRAGMPELQSLRSKGNLCLICGSLLSMPNIMSLTTRIYKQRM